MLIIATVSFSLTAFYVVITRRHRPAWKAGVVMLLSCAILTLTRILQDISSDPTAQTFWFTLYHTGYVIIPTVFLYLALCYGDLEQALTFRRRLALSLFLALAVGVIFTNGLHGWIWNPEKTAQLVSSLSLIPAAEARIGYWLLIAYAHFATGVGCFIIARSLVRLRVLYVWRVNAVFIAVILAAIGNALDVFGVSPLQPYMTTAFGFTCGSIIAAFALSPLHRYDILQITRGEIINSIGDSILVVDQDNRVVDMNPAAENLVGEPASQVVGNLLERVFPELKPGWIGNVLENGEGLLELENPKRILDLRISAIRDGQQRIVSHVIVLRDISERKRIEAELTAKREAEQKFSEQLTILATVTHELSTAQTLDALCRRAVEAGREQLGFDRLGLWFISEDRSNMIGTYGTDIHGETTDERQSHYSILPGSRLTPIIEGSQDLQNHSDAPLYHDGELVGQGSHVIAGLWDGETVIGFLTVDNLILQQPITDDGCEIIRLYASALGHLCTLKRAQESLMRLTGSLEQRVAERTKELEIANKELEAFAYSVSHDLRAPLRAIDGFTRILAENYESVFDEDGRRICGVVRDETRRMGQLIDALLTFSRLGRTGIQASVINMEALAHSVYNDLSNPEDRKRADIHVAPLPSVMGDYALIQQVWVNLISNAIKFSAKRERILIHISARVDTSEIVYSVQDNGAGFNMFYANKLFGVFQRLHTEQEFPGTGVGLAIVQRIIHRHGGRVWAESVQGEGATFFFTLPYHEDYSL